MTIRKLVEIFNNERHDGVISEELIRESVNALETKVCTEIFLTHEDPPPGVYAFMGMRPPMHRGRNIRWNTSDPLDLGNPPEPYPEPHPEHREKLPFAYHHEPGYDDDWVLGEVSDVTLLVPAPYDDVYRAYIQWRSDLAHNDTIDASNSQRVYSLAYQEFAKYWNRTHMSVNHTPFKGYY